MRAFSHKEDDPSDHHVFRSPLSAKQFILSGQSPPTFYGHWSFVGKELQKLPFDCGIFVLDGAQIADEPFGTSLQNNRLMGFLPHLSTPLPLSAFNILSLMTSTLTSYYVIVLKCDMARLDIPCPTPLAFFVL